MVIDPNRNYSLTQAADLCGINRVTLWRWIKAGKLAAYQTPTGYYRIKQPDLETFIHNDLQFLDVSTTGTPDRVLIIDDEAPFRKLIRRLLAHKQVEIEEARNGFEAGLKIMKFNPSLLILDLYMPEMDGFDVCRVLKEDPHTAPIKILAVSGASEPDLEERILGLGADAFLKKPIERQQLFTCIESLYA